MSQAGPANAQQITYWNEVSGPKWVALSDLIDAQIAPIGREAIDRAAPLPGERVLDVGCGCGASSRAAAARVAPDGRVLGVDVSAPMLAHAREAHAEVAGVEFLRADAQTHAFEAGGFEALVSRFGVMFFEAPEVAFANLRGALTAGGRLAFVCWQPLARNLWMSAPLAAAAEHLPEPLAPPEPGAPGPFAFADPDRVRRILEAAGFAGVAFESIEGTSAPGGARTPEEAARFLVEMGPTARALRDAGADDALRERVLGAVARALEAFVADDGVQAPYAAWRVTARAGA
jgi:SAM-dependent methyltransferase